MKRWESILALCLTLTLQPGHVMRTIDGDTFVLYTLDSPPEAHVRLLGGNAEELYILVEPVPGCSKLVPPCKRTEVRNEKGFEALAFTEAWLAKGPFRFMSCKKDSFGRRLATIMRDGVNLVEELRARGLGK